MADTEEGFTEQTELLERATEQIKLLGSYATAATPKIKHLTAGRDFRGLRQVFRHLSTQYDARTSDLHDVNHRLRLSWERTSDALEKRFHHSITNDEARAQFLRSTREMCSKAAEAQTSIDYFTQQVDNLPNLDKMLTRSKRKLVGELRELVSYTEDVTSFEGRLTRMLEAQD